MKATICIRKALIACAPLVVCFVIAGDSGINYQGELRNADNQPISDGEYKIRFRIYPSAENSNPLWEATENAVQTSNGSFNVEIGADDPAFHQAISNSEAPHLGIKVGTNPEIQPKQKFTAAPIAIQSHRVKEWAIGSIQMSLLTEEQFITIAGDHWVLADGRSVNGSQWHAVTGKSVVPDLRSRFIRMAKTSSKVGILENDSTAANGLAVAVNTSGGSKNTATTGAHSHAQYVTANAGTSAIRRDWSGDGNSSRYPQGLNTGSAGDHKHSVNIDHAHSTAITGDVETRPSNISVNYFLKIN
ncbi:MAG: hypothetical protein R3F19_17730 [Verrucomicrobiales bacterium]